MHYRSDYNGGHKGVVETPVDSARHLFSNDVESLARLAKKRVVTILEPCSGSGNLIAALLKVLIKERVSPSKIRIYSIERDAAALAKQRKRLRKEFPKWYPAVSFKCADFLELDFSEVMDLVVINPPWIGYKGLEKEYAQRLKGKFTYLKGQFDVLDPFIVQSFRQLNEGGKMLAFLPDKVLSSHQPSNCLDILTGETKRKKRTILPLNFFSGVQHDSVYMSLTRSKAVSTRGTVSSIRKLGDYFRVFRGLEISGRRSEYLVQKASDSKFPKRPFVTGADLSARTRQPTYLSKRTPDSLVKEHFKYRGPCVLVRKTGAPVAVRYRDRLPLTSQVVFNIVPKSGPTNPEVLKSVADYLASSEGQQQLSRNSGKLSRGVFPYITISDVNNVVLPASITKNLDEISIEAA